MFRRLYPYRVLPILLGVVLAIGFGMAPQPARAQAGKAEMERIREALAGLEKGQGYRPGREIYLVACAGCHGVKGDGVGLGAQGFAQRPTNFTLGVYKFRSTAFGALPTDADLERSIREGMPGTEMVPFATLLNREARMAVVQYIKSFSPAFDDPDNLPKAKDMVAIPTKRPFPRTDATIEAGQEVWSDQGCDDCHGERGLGNADEEDEQGFPVHMVPFSLGYYKSGYSDADLYRTIATGMNNTTMEAYRKDTTEEQRWQLVDFIRSLEQTDGWLGWLLSDRPNGFGYGHE